MLLAPFVFFVSAIFLPHMYPSLLGDTVAGLPGDKVFSWVLMLGFMVTFLILCGGPDRLVPRRSVHWPKRHGPGDGR